MLRIIILLQTVLVFSLALGPIGLAHSGSFSLADLVVVKKSNRKLYLYSGDRLLKSYNIRLGKNPVGHKLQRGDSRTPEGRYLLDWRNPQSRFHRSIHISYPNAQDRRRALELGVDPGDSIMIHGLPNRYRDAEEFFMSRDWTEGCIAVSNRAMSEIWRMVANNTVIEIHP